MTDSSRVESRPKASFEEYELEVGTYDVRLSTGIRATADPTALRCYLDEPLYSSDMELYITAKIVFPFHFNNMECGVFVQSSGLYDKWSKVRVRDVQRRDENGKPSYLEHEGEWVPELDAPRSIGHFDIDPEDDDVFVGVSLPFWLVQEFRTALSLGHTTRIFVGVLNTGTDRLIQHIDYSTPGLFRD